MTIYFEPLGAEHIHRLLHAVSTNPRQVLLATSEETVHVGVPLPEILRKPYGQSHLVLGVVTLTGICVTTGHALRLGINQNGYAIVQPQDESNALRRWTTVTKDGEPLRILLPTPYPPTTRYQVRQHELAE